MAYKFAPKRLTALALAALLAQVPAHALSLKFYDLTKDSAAAKADGESNLLVDVLDLGNDTVRFHFTNASTSALTEVYFDDGSLLSLATITSSSGVSFAQGATPPNLPGANLATPPFQVTQGFLADANNPGPKNGVSQGEWLNIDFKLKNGQTYQDTVKALSLPNNGGDGDLRIGVHVTGYSGNASDSFINIAAAAPAVPEASSAMMLLAGLGSLGFVVRRRSGSGR